jgi:hypothetical protein
MFLWCCNIYYKKVDMSSMAQMLNALCVFIMLERQIILFIY